ncbi:MAG: hypothetical protein A2087_03135 [Spirochaetes bacterium GWD1_61_31]|nr:MAG: hypothetical protein A2Y37_12660 [Spirochaetes bacterium GWB1_60_80]OHD32940.1 MAG: hypothetical protein A2004_01045 [Spirochaetes bacterium GWC1_61_12]OHD38691.1 MAG: hypothetical protein A2087_03135 [Spirochaetes bacterium GWD1_61_31]HAP42695.1 class I SAM-dependent methyltransferase [Spirochaetaceae bacterium]HAW84998.1 class I SAM-dependent methyltransferase [Spirochaetaceae bacterium]
MRGIVKVVEKATGFFNNLLMDISQVQRNHDQMVATREGYTISIIDGDMSQPFPFPANSFDLIVHPESNNWIRDVRHLWRESCRVLKPGGILLAGFANPLLYLFSGDETPADLRVTNKLPYDPIATLSEEALSKMAENSIQFSHSLESQIGGQLEAGLQLTHLLEDVHHEGALAAFTPAFIATRAVKPA